MNNCPLTGSSNIQIIYEQKGVPLIQNKVYSSAEIAKAAKTINVVLAQSLENGFVFNASFDDTMIEYDIDYQNEQSNSIFFLEHLENVKNLMAENQLLKKKIIEIGCGKAFFMNLLLDQGEDIMGFDPAYEGKSSRVIKDFFSDKYSDLKAETIILRHTLEHISKPFHFIQAIAKANNYKGKIYIEVPAFEWIVKKNACEDIFYEHCNYFTLETLQYFFTQSIGGHFFNEQYIYVIADLANVKVKLEKCPFHTYHINFDYKIEEYKDIVAKYTNIAIWGAGAKGSTFLNLVDKTGSKIKCVIDISHRKQNQFIGSTGHRIIHPKNISDYNIENIIIMNQNYLDEIRATISPLNINLITI